MNSAWLLALPLILLPVWWHRRRREQGGAQPLASARFVPRAEPQKKRMWRWRERLLLMLRCLLLAAVIGWLADFVLPWRPDAVIIVPGTDPAWALRQIQAARLDNADRLALATPDAFGWLAHREREWQTGARVLLLGDVAMPALLPRTRLQLEVRSQPRTGMQAERRVFLAGAYADKWRRLFTALDGPHRYRIGGAYGATPFDASVPPPPDAAQARAVFEAWEQRNFAPPAYTTPSQRIGPDLDAPSPDSGALRYLLTLALMALFALERIVTHAQRR